jgi:hypothetical protein
LVYSGFTLDRILFFRVECRQDFVFFRVQLRQDFGLFRVQFRQDSGLFRVQFRQDSGLFRVQLRQDSVFQGSSKTGFCCSWFSVDRILVYSGFSLDRILFFMVQCRQDFGYPV